MEHLNSFRCWVFGLCCFDLILWARQHHLTLRVLQRNLSASSAHLLFAFYASIDQLWLPKVLPRHWTHHVAPRWRRHRTSSSHDFGEVRLWSRSFRHVGFIVAHVLVKELIFVAVSIFALSSSLDLVNIWIMVHSLFATVMLSVGNALLDEVTEYLEEIQLGGLLLLRDSDVQLPVLNGERRGVLFSWGAGFGLWFIRRIWCVYVLDTSAMLFLVAENLFWHQAFIIDIVVAMMSFLLHVCVDSRVNEVIVWAVIAQFIVFVFLRARFHVALSLTSFRFEALQRMNRSLTEVVIWAFGVRRSTISLTKVRGQISLAFNCLQVATSLIRSSLSNAWPFSLQTSQVKPLVLAWIAKRSTIEWLLLLFSKRMALVTSSHAGISRWVRALLLASIIHAAARSQRGASRHEVVVAAAVRRLHHDVSMVHLTPIQRYAWVAVIGLRNVDLVLKSWNVSGVEVLLNSGAGYSADCGIWVVKWAIIQIIGVVMLAYRLQLKSICLLLLLLLRLLLTVAKVGLLDHHRRSASKKLVLHLHVAKVRLGILVYLNASFCPHLEVVIDLMLPQRLVDLWPFFIYFAIVDIFVIYWGLHAKNAGVLQMLILVLIYHL